MYNVYVITKVTKRCIVACTAAVNSPLLPQVLIPALHIHLTGTQNCCANRCGVSRKVKGQLRHTMK